MNCRSCGGHVHLRHNAGCSLDRGERILEIDCDGPPLCPRHQRPDCQSAQCHPERSPTEAVNHPRHYNESPSGIECIEVIRHMSFNVGSAVKYCWRLGLKGPTVEELRKAIWYLTDEVKRLEKLAEK